jgi:hypothetical protein
VRDLWDADPAHPGVAKVLTFLPGLPEALTCPQSETSPPFIASELLGCQQLSRLKMQAISDN